MEARLFLISLWCGLYSLALRRFYRREHLQTVWTTIGFNAIFWATVGVVLGMLRASYMTGAEFEFKYSLWYAIVGFILGGGLGYFKGREAEKRDKLLKDNLEWADTGFSAILLASVVMFFVVQAFKIPSGSMRMTFVEGDHLFVNKFIYGFPIPFTKMKVVPLKKVEQGDIVIFRFPTKDKRNQHHGKDFIKRVVAVQGQTVRIKDKKLFVDDVELQEPYKQHVDPNIYTPSYVVDIAAFQQQWVSSEFSGIIGNEIRDNFGPVTIPEGHVLVLGDNRDRSFDSRFWGPLPLSAIKGKALFLYWPFKRLRVIHS